MWDNDSNSRACVRLEAPQKIVPALTKEPAIEHIGRQKIKAVRNVEGVDGIPNRLVVIDPRALTSAGHVNRLVGVEVKLGVEELHAKAPMGNLRREIREASAVVQR